ncbi:MAG: hypothetical protein AUG08_11075 [Acidobacteria bacterium 13_1_20CM_2_55_15]|nr:MAG: hypothetical protein AUG08_11075 [Acidobacteria bacterium 13_1_20CM_2_55_15]
MGLLKELRLRFRPPRMEDPDFGVLLYMHIPHAPANSYWEGEWLFPATRTKVAIALPGGLDGPDIKARAFYLELSTQFDHVVKQVWPALDRVFREWIGRPLDTDLWKDVRLSGFGVEPLNIVPITWDVMFETTGEKWLAITVPFVGDSPQDPVVDT